MSSIAFEISPLITASGSFGDKSGVYRYMHDLLVSLVKHIEKEKTDTKIILFSFTPSLLNISLNSDILQILKSPKVELLEIDTKSKKRRVKNSLRDTMGIPILRYPLYVFDRIFHIRSILQRIKKKKAFREYVQVLNSQLKEKNVSIIFHSETGFYPMPQFKNVITIYDITTELFPEFHREETCDLQHRKLLFAKNHCEGIVTISESTKNDLLNLSYSFRKKKILVAYPGVNDVFRNKYTSVKKFKDVCMKNSLDLKRKKYFLFYGTFEPRKNIPSIVRAFSELVEEKKLPNDFKLVLIGGKGWGKVRNHVQRFLEEFNAKNKNRIILLDYVPDEMLRTCIVNSFAVLYPSLYEGFGLPVLESMALGVAVICSNSSSLPEVGGNATIFVNPKKYDEIKNKILFLSHHPKIARNYAQKSLLQSKKFSWEKTGKHVYLFLKSI